MRRRGVTVLLGALVVVALVVGVVSVPVPYVVMGPGPTVDTLGQDDGKDIIQISGAATSSSAGQLRLTTVAVDSRPDLITSIAGWFDGDRAVVPRELVYPADQSEEQVEQRNQEEFKASQTSAETAALAELGYPVRVTITRVVPDGAAAGTLRIGDVVTAVDGEPVTSARRLGELVRAKPAGTALRVSYRRGEQERTTSITTRADKTGDPPRLGVEIEERQPHPFSLEIELNEIGGPSAGLMFSLGIVDKLRPEDLTGGKIIAGTGTIDAEGRVGAIGGVAQKLVGAKRAGAVVFLTPADNCVEAVANALPGLPLARVATLDDALEALQAVREGRRPESC
ncbi:MAG TPA: PDZ domain-containing protein [Pilimelia sp.]|nr:PDZ domain-containing protein [Pilimelia sp.]